MQIPGPCLPSGNVSLEKFRQSLKSAYESLMVYAQRTEKFANVSELKLNKDKQFPMEHQNFNNIDCNQYFLDITHYTCL